MKNQNSKIVKSMVSLFVLISILSCSKDTDLLADYVISDFNDVNLMTNLTIADDYVFSPQQSIVLDVLANDTFTNPDKVEIISVSQPSDGFVVINENKTLTYFPDSSDAQSSDEAIDTSDKDEGQQTPSTEVGESTEISDGEEIEESTEQEQQEQLNDENLSNGEEQSIDQTLEENKSETTTEEFEYTVETEDENGNKTTQNAQVTVTTQLGELKAFPGAEGFGRNTSGGRGGFVYHVKNLNDKGPGSLRYGLQNIKGKRTIVFDISGYIDLKSTMKIKRGYGNVTIAGQTAPGDGITLRGNSFWIQDSNVIMRYIRIRPGAAYTPGYSDDALRIVNTTGNTIEDVIIDHCSLSWGHDEVFSIAGSNDEASFIKNITVQNTIVSEAIDNEYATLINKNIQNVTFYKNLYAHNRERNILFNNPPFGIEFVNNIVYNFSRGMILFYNTKADVIGNAYITNANSGRVMETIRLEVSDQPKDGTRLFTYDNTEDGGAITISKGGTHNLLPHLAQTPFFDSELNYLPSSELLKHILPDVGASNSRDATDLRIIDDVTYGTGKRINHEDEVGGFPPLTIKRHPENYDKDNDGISDQWEISNNLDPKNSDDGKADSDGDGYTNLESFLFSLTI